MALQMVSLAGLFWVYYNTRQSAPPKEKTPEWEHWKKSPWVIRRFKHPFTYPDIGADLEAKGVRMVWEGTYPRLGWFEDILCSEVEIIGTCRTVYEEDPPWKNQRTTIKSVRGFLRVDGIVRYR